MGSLNGEPSKGDSLRKCFALNWLNLQGRKPIGSRGAAPGRSTFTEVVMSGMSKVSWQGRLSALTVAAAVAVAGCAQGAPRELRATPANVAAVLASARDGDTVILAKGVYSQLRMPKRTFSKPLVIDATAATIEGLSGKDVDGVEIRGGAFRLPPAFVSPKNGKLVYPHGVRLDQVKNVRLVGITMTGPASLPNAPEGTFGEGTGVLIAQSEGIEIADSRFSGLKNGVVMSRVSGFRVLRNTFAAQRSDGVTIGEGRSGLIEGNECRDTKMRDNEHPDCIQLFSRPTSPPTADIIIRKNRASGATQGIGMFNHTRDGVNDGGFDRILIEDNDLNVGFPNGIGLTDARDSIVRNNRVETFPGSKYAARISIRGSGDVKRCGNVVKGGAGKSGETDRTC